MITANFAVAVVTVILRGLVDRILASMQAPAARDPILPSSASTFMVSGVLFFLYKRFFKGRKIFRSSNNNVRNKILNGRVHKTSSQTSSGSWSVRNFRPCRSRSKERKLIDATQDTLKMLHREPSSTSLSSKSSSSEKCRCDIASKERSPSLYSVKSEKIEDNPDTDNPDAFKGFGDCHWKDRPKISRRRKRVRTTRKTRSGKVYSYV